jgi:nucleotide-binding universal stress UspA family protein
VGTHDRTGVHRWVVGSAAEGLLHETTLPVFVVKTRLKRSLPA